MIHVPKQSAATAGGSRVSCRRFSAVFPSGLYQHRHHGHRGRVTPQYPATWCGVYVYVDGVFALISGHSPFLCFGHKGLCRSQALHQLLLCCLC